MVSPFVLQGQTGNFIHKLENQVINPGAFRLPEIPFTAIVIKSIEDHGPSINIRLGTDTVAVPLDPDAPEYTYFISLSKKDNIEVLIEDTDTYQLILINSGSSPAVRSNFRMSAQNICIDPINAIPQSEWRAGLPNPTYSRIATNVEHVVVHHSAGANTNTNYTQVVRDIYLYHTQVNGWSDIGYNYLIAQDGSVYKGRDPASLDQDNVLGAHFCGANSNTMGVCLLGNYETADISSAASSSLQNLLAWKMEKEGLTPYTTHQHAIGLFEAIIGHRDGCSTLCPGTNVYQILTDIKSDVKSLLDCSNPTAYIDFEAPSQVINARAAIPFSNLSNGYDSYEWIFEGGNPERASWSDVGSVTYNYPGVFNVALIGISEGIRDTLIREDYLEVQGQPIVFPNPLGPLDPLVIQYHHQISRAELFGMDGKQHRLKFLKDGHYTVPFLRPGLYLLRVYTDTEVFSKKIRIE